MQSRLHAQSKYFDKPMKITGKGKDRIIVCPVCNEAVSWSLPPHMREKHSDVWDEWCLEFLNLYNKGNSPIHIMKVISVGGRPPFTWRVIATEIKRIAEERKMPLLPAARKVTRWKPEEFDLQRTTIWQFKDRGDWAVHQSDYQGNWPPEIPRNLVLHYLNKGDLVLDPFVGGGTTLIESRLLGVNSIGLDISPHSISYTKQKMAEMTKSATRCLDYRIPVTDWIVIKGDARSLGLKDGSIDLICGQPPYADIIKYTFNIPGDLSLIHDLNEYYEEIKKVARELYRVLRKGKYCAILVGDIRRNKDIVPLGFNVMQSFLEAGFVLNEIIVKTQHKQRSTQNFYLNRDVGELRFIIAHEYLFIFRKDASST